MDFIFWIAYWYVWNLLFSRCRLSGLIVNNTEHLQSKFEPTQINNNGCSFLFNISLLAIQMVFILIIKNAQRR